VVARRNHSGKGQGRSGSTKARERRNVKLEARINYRMRNNNAGIFAPTNCKTDKLI